MYLYFILQRKAEESVKAAESELRAAVDSLTAEEKARADKIADLGTFLNFF